MFCLNLVYIVPTLFILIIILFFIIHYIYSMLINKKSHNSRGYQYLSEVF